MALSLDPQSLQAINWDFSSQGQSSATATEQREDSLTSNDHDKVSDQVQTCSTIVQTHSLPSIFRADVYQSAVASRISSGFLESSSKDVTIHSDGEVLEMNATAYEDAARDEGPISSLPVAVDHHNTTRFATTKLVGHWFPKNNPGYPKAKTLGTRLSERQSLLYICFAITSIVLGVNISALATFSTKWNPQDDFGTLFHGDCDVAARINTLLHLAINVLSTMLLASSNLCMQLLASPTRIEVDAAHARGRWVDIGTPSFRNLWSIRKSRLAVWCVLGLSSLPLHFL